MYKTLLIDFADVASIYTYEDTSRIIINGDKYLTKDAKVAWLWPIHIKRANPWREQKGTFPSKRRGPSWTINDIGPWFSRRYDGTIAGFCLVCPLLLLPWFLLPSSTIWSYPQRLDVLFLLLFFSLPFLPSSERRQVSVRVAVNSLASLSALMSLLLFALLNAIRAYSVSLPPLLESRATTSFRLPRTNVVVHARMRSHTRAREFLDPRHDSFALTRLRNRYTNTHATRGRARTRGIAPRGRRGHSNQPQTCIRTLLCNF